MHSQNHDLVDVVVLGGVYFGGDALHVLDHVDEQPAEVRGVCFQFGALCLTRSGLDEVGLLILFLHVQLAHFHEYFLLCTRYNVFE